jgi:hypothetical protein
MNAINQALNLGPTLINKRIVSFADWITFDSDLSSDDCDDTELYD